MKVTALICLLATFVTCQVNINASPDPEWPKYQTTELDYIQMGATVNNTQGYWMDGSYSIVTNLLGD